MVRLESKIETLKLEGVERYRNLVQRHLELEAARNREKAVDEYAIRKMGLWKDEYNGQCDVVLDILLEIPDERHDEFYSEYLPIVQEGYRELFGLDYPINYNPLYSEFEKPFWDAEKAFLMLAPAFIRLNGKENEGDADALEKAIGGYMRDEHRNKLISLNCQFLGLPVPEFYKI